MCGELKCSNVLQCSNVPLFQCFMLNKGPKSPKCPLDLQIAIDNVSVKLKADS